MDKSDTIVALATAMGSGSIAVIRVSGTDSISTLNRVFEGKNLEKTSGNTIHFGRIVFKNKEVDQVLVFIFKAPNSYTGENAVEISCHANHFIVEEIISILIENGARHANPGEFTLRAFLNHKLDLAQAEAVSNVISSKSKLATRNSILQLEGILSDKIKKTKQRLIDLVSHLEIDLDFSEENLTIIPKETILERINSVISDINHLIDSYNSAKILNGSIEVAIIGKPNVGKSSLLNTLLGEDRAIVTSYPGTTRDTIEENMIISNILLKIYDTAGIRISENIVEKKGIDRSWKAARKADIVLWVIDMSNDLEVIDNEIYKQIQNTDHPSVIIAGNKTDLGVLPELEMEIKTFSFPLVKMSAKTGQGLNKLKSQIVKTINSKYKNLGDEIIVTSLRQKQALEKSKQALLTALKTIKNDVGYEFAAVDIRESLTELSKITGETATDDILNNIFKNFCIGK